jgi:hypothetical protein
VSRDEAHSWVEALEPLLTAEEQQRHAKLLECDTRILLLQQQIEAVQAERQELSPEWGTDLSLYQWALDIRDCFMSDGGVAIMREAIVFAILYRIHPG